MHFQFPPAAETKVVRCTRGAIVDIIVDLRPESPTYLEHVAVRLDEENGRCALRARSASRTATRRWSTDTETSYFVGEFYTPEAEGGLSPHDPRLGLDWPLPVSGDLARRTPTGRPSTRSSRRCAGEWRPRDHRRHGTEGARGRGAPDPRRHRRRRLHEPGPDEPDRQQRPRDARGRDLESAARACGARSSATRASSRRSSSSQAALRGRRRARRRRRTPTIRSSSAGASTSTSSAR